MSSSGECIYSSGDIDVGRCFQISTHWGFNKMVEILQTIFFNLFCWENVCIFIFGSNFTDIFSPEDPNDSGQQVRFGSGNFFSPYRQHTITCTDVNSSDAGGGIFRLLRSIPYLLMHWLLKLPVHQQAWYWLCKTNMYCCSRVNFIHLGQAKSKIQFEMWIYIL